MKSCACYLWVCVVDNLVFIFVALRHTERAESVKYELTAALDAAAQSVDMTRHSNTVCNIPFKNMRSGISSLPKLKAQEYPGVILLVMVILGTSNKYLDTNTTRNVQVALSAMYLLWMILRRTWMDKEEIRTRLPDLVRK